MKCLLPTKLQTWFVRALTEPETFGRVSVEAQSMGVPVIASDIGGSTETIIDDKTGFLFKSGDSKALANAIIMVMQQGL